MFSVPLYYHRSPLLSTIILLKAKSTSGPAGTLSEVLLHRNNKMLNDSFGNKRFEKIIISSFIDQSLVEKIFPADSQTVAGLQFIDNICSVLRAHESQNDRNHYYEILKDIVNVA